jgi:hypothetical protein
MLVVVLDQSLFTVCAGMCETIFPFFEQPFAKAGGVLGDVKKSADS